jgi:serine/threonine-protein kinase
MQLLEKEPQQRPADAGVVQRRLDALRRKQERKVHAPAEEAPSPTAGPGPATVAARLWRAELEGQKEGGPGSRLLGKAWVVVPAFLLSLGVLVWALWPTGPETLYARGAALMQSDNPDDWEEGWDKYLAPLEEKYPDHPHKAEVADFKKKYELAKAVRSSRWAAKNTPPPSEAQAMYLRGLRLRQLGKEDEAKRVWKALSDAFRNQPVEAPWVRLADERWAEGGRDTGRDLAPLRTAVALAKHLRELGQVEDAVKIEKALHLLYDDDPSEAVKEALKELPP